MGGAAILKSASAWCDVAALKIPMLKNQMSTAGTVGSEWGGVGGCSVERKWGDVGKVTCESVTTVVCVCVCE